MHLATAQAQIQAAAQRTVSRCLAGQTPEPFRAEQPVTLKVELATSEMADKAMMIPGARRPGGKVIEITAEDMPTAYRAMRAAVSLARA